MGIQPVVKRQIFISYAHADDIPMGEGVEGWVTLFVKNLRTTIRRYTRGTDVDVWMDHQLDPQRRVNAELRARIAESAIFLAFMSPRYLDSQWCRGEMEGFIELVGSGSSANRVFIVGVLPTERDEWNEAAREISEVQLWERTLADPTAHTLAWPVPKVTSDQEYWRKVTSLAGAISRQLDELRLIDRSGLSVVGPPSGTSGVAPSPLPKARPSQPSSSGPLSIVLHAAAEEDQRLIDATRSMLFELDADAYLAPGLAEGQSPADHRAAAEVMLRESHGVLVLYGSAPPSWVQSKHTEARKVLRRERKGTWAGLLEGPPEPKQPHGLPERGLMVLDWKRGFQKEELHRFLDALRQEQTAVAGHV